MERCPSGRRSTPGKCVYVLKAYRGFESHPLRHCSHEALVSVLAVACTGCLPALRRWKLRQAREGAAVTADANAGWLAGVGCRLRTLRS